MPDNPKVEDLNALVPRRRVIKIGDPPKEIEIKQPRLKALMTLGTLGGKMRKADTMTDEEFDKLEAEMKAEIVNVIPEIEGVDLGPYQLLRLVEILTEMGKAPKKFRQTIPK